MLRLRRNRSVVSMLRDREIRSMCAPDLLSANIISRTLRSSTNDRLYTKHWRKTSFQAIEYHAEHLFLSGYTQYSSIYSKNDGPPTFSEMERSNAVKPIKGAISYSTPVYTTIDSICKCGSNRCICLSQYLLTYSLDNWLCQHLITNGRLIRQVYTNRTGTGERFRFQTCDWNVYGESIALISSDDPKMRTASEDRDAVVTLAVFTAIPFEFSALMEIKSSVFGNAVSTARLFDQLLLICMLDMRMRIYNFEEFLNNGILTPRKLGESFGDEGGIIGTFPTGLPVNFTYREAPPVLYNIERSERFLDMGSDPLHYIVRNQVWETENYYAIRNMETNTEVIRRYFDFSSDEIIFHPDGSDRLIFKTRRTVDCYKLTNRNGVSSISQLFSMSFSVDEYVIASIYYASDLNLLALLGVNSGLEGVGLVKLCDNSTGEEVRTIELASHLFARNTYRLFFDMATVIILEKSQYYDISTMHIYYL